MPEAPSCMSASAASRTTHAANAYHAHNGASGGTTVRGSVVHQARAGSGWRAVFAQLTSYLYLNKQHVGDALDQTRSSWLVEGDGARE